VSIPFAMLVPIILGLINPDLDSDLHSFD